MKVEIGKYYICNDDRGTYGLRKGDIVKVFSLNRLCKDDIGFIYKGNECSFMISNFVRWFEPSKEVNIIKLLKKVDAL